MAKSWPKNEEKPGVQPISTQGSTSGKTRLLKTRSITIPRGMVRWGDELKSEHISRSSQLGELRFQFTANHGGGKR